jgi:hypothetical protein
MAGWRGAVVLSVVSLFATVAAMGCATVNPQSDFDQVNA